jgi:hypothetical protein
MNKSVELFFQLSLEIVSSFDLFTDLFVLRELSKSSDVGWLCTMIMTIVWPFLVSYVPFISYQLGKIRETENSEDERLPMSTMIKALLFTTPLLLAYLLLIDTVFLAISSILVPILLLVSFMSCQRIRHASIDRFIDRSFEIMFGMQ